MTVVPAYLQDFICEGKVIPFVGAGVSMAVRRTDGRACYPSWKDLLGRAAARLTREGKPEAAATVQDLLAKNDYLEASTHARKALRNNWYRFLKSQLSFRRDEIDTESLALARAIWDLGSRLIITTNYDRVLLWGCPELPDLHRWDIDAPYEQVAALRDGVEAPTLWHLHGTIDNVTKLILTPDGYQRLYPDFEDGSGVPTEQRHHAALKTLQQHLTSYSFLFIGFSLDDAALLGQLQEVDDLFEGAAAQHYILAREAEREAMTQKIEQWNLPVDVVTFADFGPPLLDSLAQMARYTRQPEVSPTASKPTSPSTPAPRPPTSAASPPPPPAGAPAAPSEALAHDDDDAGEIDEDGLNLLLGASPPSRKLAVDADPSRAKGASAGERRRRGGRRESQRVLRDGGARPASPVPPHRPKRSAEPVAKSDHAPRDPAEPDEQLLLLSRRLYARPLHERRVAARRVAELTEAVSLDSLLSLSTSAEPEHRVAAGIGLRTHLEIDPRLADDPRIHRAVERGLTDGQARVRYRFLESIQAATTLIDPVRNTLEALRDDPNAPVASKARETLDLGPSEG
ncbi:MAG: SIR2 family protein [Myxococcota bacterium]